MSGQPGTAMARKAARLAAVQAIYQMELTGADANTVTEEFREHRFGQCPPQTSEPEPVFFVDLVHGVPQHQVEIDRAIAQNLSEGWTLQRIDSILRAILRAGVYELAARKDVPAKVVIDQYLDVAHAFFAGEEPAFVNAVLDRVARKKRAAEFGKAIPDDELRF
ncbi:MAG: transcription antitermination factor NusB [Alphaproteobacteria bacterium]|nr:transcription antitermination factor NusB [Alphaproteobacteria bacterium]